MAIERIFFNWKVSFLRQAASFLVEHYTLGNNINMSSALIVVPGRRVGRRLIELLVEAADGQGKALELPRIVTTGALPESLYRPARPYANELERRMAWVSALQEVPLNKLQMLLAESPKIEDLVPWLDLADRIDVLYSELSAADRTFTDVATQVLQDLGEVPAQRWALLDQVKDKYLEHLVVLGLSDQHDCRRLALHTHEVFFDQEIYLLATPDLNCVTRQFLQLANDSLVVAMINAPEEEQGSFDQFGCLVVEKWVNRPIVVDDRQLLLVDRPADQAQAVIECLRQFGSRYTPQQVVVGLADPEISPFIVEVMSTNGIVARPAAGIPIAMTAPFRLLRALSRYMSSHSFFDLATLLRHSDFSRLVLAKIGLEMTDRELSVLLDEYHSQHFPGRVVLGGGLNSEWPVGCDDRLDKVLAVTFTLLQDLLISGEHFLSEWAYHLSDFLADVYGDRELNRHKSVDRQLIDVCEKISQQLHSLSQLKCARLVEAPVAIAVLIESMKCVEVPEEPLIDAVELLGWLELVLDDSEALIVTSMNEGFVPQTLNADPFLPNGLRQELGLPDNDRRYARDAYALTTLLAGREEIRFIVGKHGLAGEPLLPSRLLLTADSYSVAIRLEKFFAAKPLLVGGRNELIRYVEVSVPPKPKPTVVADPLRISVTSLRDYLECPYLYYLRNCLKLRQLDDSARELDALQFGNLAHSVLKDFSSSEIKLSSDSEQIKKFLWVALRRCVRVIFGAQPPPSVQLQIFQLRQRFAVFAQKQAEWRSQGWSMIDSEFSLERSLPVDGPGKNVILHGRIDRLDRHDLTGSWTVFDYKTGENVKQPERQHQRGKGWVDLQLPAYRYLLANRGEIELDQLDLGYFSLGAGVSQSGPLLAKWTAENYCQAEREMRRVSGAILAQDFKLQEGCKGRCREYAALCGVNQLLADEEYEEEQAS